MVFLVILLINILMATISAMVAGSKRGGFTGLLFFFYGLLLGPIALVHALLMGAAPPEPMRADGFVAGKPYWSDGRGGYVARVDGRDLVFRNVEEMQTALGGEIVALEQEPELIGKRLWRKISEM